MQTSPLCNCQDQVRIMLQNLNIAFGIVLLPKICLILRLLLVSLVVFFCMALPVLFISLHLLILLSKYAASVRKVD
jgi:hypothetical protein